MKLTKRLVTMAAAAILALGALSIAGCATTAASDPNAEAQAQNRAYMTQVNQTMEDLSDRLDSFNEAVSRGDVVTMKGEAENAYKCIASIESLEAPEALKDIKQSYVDGCNSLKSALDSYIALYTEVESATAEAPFDYSTFQSRIQEIQGLYDQGIAKLQEADEKATSA